MGMAGSLVIVFIFSGDVYRGLVSARNVVGAGATAVNRQCLLMELACLWESPAVSRSV